tara:strand:- start:2767 stop:3027 length:261 start_codon:yes stop_codon:yes gene_type:complete
MALTERADEDKIEIVGPYKIIQVRTATVVERDGVELTRAFERKALAPDADVSGESVDVQAIANVIWTQEIKDAYAAHVAASQPNGE